MDKIQEFILRHRGLRQRSAAAYAVSCALITVAIGIRLVVGDALVGAPYLTIFPAVIVATFLGGLGPGLFAAALGGVGAWYFLLPPAGSFALEVHSAPLSLIVYAGVAGFDCLLINWLITIAEQNAALARRNDLLLRELQHRVKNHLQIVSALLGVHASRSDSGARDVLLDMRRRLDVIASLYANESHPTEQVDLTSYLKQVCDVARQSFGRDDCDVRVSLPPDPVPWNTDRIMPLALILNELLTNAFRHGLAQGRGRIEVSLQRVDGGVELSVCDDGGRLPAGFDVAGGAGLGLSIVQRLAAQIGAGVRIVNNGHPSFVVTLPVPSSRHAAQEGQARRPVSPEAL